MLKLLFLFYLINLAVELSVGHDKELIILKINNFTNNENSCENSTAIENFPADIFTHEQKQKGAILLHCFAAIYFFTFLAVICNDYFLPSVECICDDLHLPTDVAAATFMASATTTPELFSNVVSTFVAESDMGLGTIIGSLLFNTLGVAAIAGLAAVKPVQLDWWPITRDCIMFSINIMILLCITWDGKIYWYEGLIFFILYMLYFCILFQNKKIMNFFKKYIEGKWHLCTRSSYDIRNTINFETENKDKSLDHTLSNNIVLTVSAPIDQSNSEKLRINNLLNNSIIKTRKSLWLLPQNNNVRNIWWFYTWPIKCVLTITIPSPKTFRALYPLTFIMCIVWIALNSYLIVFMITMIGYTLHIPDTVMGLVFLAAGGCLPEVMSCVIMTRKGEGGMGVSNSLGANSLSILLSLGFPWFIKTLVNKFRNGSNFIIINSEGIIYIIISLLLAVSTLYFVVSISRYRLKKSVGLILFIAYACFVTFAILIEMGVIFPSMKVC